MELLKKSSLRHIKFINQTFILVYMNVTIS